METEVSRQQKMRQRVLALIYLTGSRQKRRKSREGSAHFRANARKCPKDSEKEDSCRRSARTAHRCPPSNCVYMSEHTCVVACPYLRLDGGQRHRAHVQVEALHAHVLLNFVGFVEQTRVQTPAEINGKRVTSVIGGHESRVGLEVPITSMATRGRLMHQSTGHLPLLELAQRLDGFVQLLHFGFQIDNILTQRLGFVGYGLVRGSVYNDFVLQHVRTAPMIL